MTAARRGDQGAFAELHRRYEPPIREYCGNQLRSCPDEVDDAVQETFVSAWRHLDGLREPERFRPWLYTIAARHALARRRHRLRTVPSSYLNNPDELDRPDETAAPGPEDTALDRDRSSLLTAALQGLEPGDQVIVRLHLEGLTGEGLGERLDVGGNDAAVRLYRAKSRLRDALDVVFLMRGRRGSCRRLDALLNGWHGRLTPLLRKRVVRHVRQCGQCDGRRRRLVTAESVLGLAALLVAPPELRRAMAGELLPTGVVRPLPRGLRPALAARLGGLSAAALVAVLLWTGVVPLPGGGDQVAPGTRLVEAPSDPVAGLLADDAETVVPPGADRQSAADGQPDGTPGDIGGRPASPERLPAGGTGNQTGTPAGPGGVPAGVQGAPTVGGPGSGDGSGSATGPQAAPDGGTADGAGSSGARTGEVPSPSEVGTAPDSVPVRPACPRPSVSGAVAVRQMPPSFRFDRFTDETRAALVPERRGYRLPVPVQLDPDGTGPQRPRTVPAGTLVDSYVLHADQRDHTANGRYDGRIRLPAALLGVAHDASALDRTDRLIGRPGTEYETHPGRQMEPQDVDFLVLDGNRRTLRFRMDILMGTDTARIVTRHAPPPAGCR